MVFFRRKAYDRLQIWKEKSDGCTAILVEGAPRVGKTTVVKEFVSKNYKSYIFIDFSVADRSIFQLFEETSTDFDEFFMRLQFITKTTLYKRQSVVVFDEVQLCPRARQMIKHLVADHRYDYIETGTFVSCRKYVRKILIPSEEEKLQMYPMDFEEFLWATGDQVTADFIREDFKNRTPAGDLLHNVIMKRYQKYMIIGGMPEVVDVYLREKSLKKVEAEKQRLLDLYRKDLLGLSKILSSRSLQLLESVPSMLSSKKKIVMPSKIQEGTRMRDYTGARIWLSGTKILNPCICKLDPSKTYPFEIDEYRVKPYLFDTGLLISLVSGKDDELNHRIYSALMNGKLFIDEGMFFENMVAQELVSHGHKLIFTEFKVKGSTRVYEIEFLSMGLNTMSPIVVKHTESSCHRALDVFCEKFRRRTERPVVIHSKDLREENGILYIPIYMTMFL